MIGESSWSFLPLDLDLNYLATLLIIFSVFLLWDFDFLEACYFLSYFELLKFILSLSQFAPPFGF